MTGSSAPEEMEERFYYDDTDAPQVNVPLKPGVASVIFDEHHRILILKRTRGPYWSLPGGRQDAGESAPECCVRETFEETGLITTVKRLIGLYTNARSICSYPDSNVHQSYVALFECEVTGGDLQQSDETGGWHWLTPEELEEGRFDLIPDNVLNCRDAWSGQVEAFVR